jgi:hypothetical protein
MTSLYWKKNKKPNIDIRVSPFALDRQLEDQKFSMMHNRVSITANHCYFADIMHGRILTLVLYLVSCLMLHLFLRQNPRGVELAKGEKLRSEKFVKKSDPSALKTKAKVINKIVREVSGVHTYALIPPIEKRDKRVKEEVDPDTHPLMKPYRDESTRNPVMCSFGHRPSSASRTFHPSTMNFRLQHEEVAAVASKGQSGFGLQPAVLAKLLHAPPLAHDQGDDSKSGSRPPSGWEDPLGLFLPSEDLFDKSVASTSMEEGSGRLGHGGVLEHSKSWNTGTFSDNGVGAAGFNGTTSFAKSRSRRPKKANKKKDYTVVCDLICSS